jgi:hypothetical protein
MSQYQGDLRPNEDALPNGTGAAAILAAGIGCAAVGILAFAGDASDAIGRLPNFYNPTGTLSGVTTVAILVWVVAWLILDRLWHGRTVSMTTVNVLAFSHDPPGAVANGRSGVRLRPLPPRLSCLSGSRSARQFLREMSRPLRESLLEPHYNSAWQVSSSGRANSPALLSKSVGCRTWCTNRQRHGCMG